MANKTPERDNQNKDQNAKANKTDRAMTTNREQQPGKKTDGGQQGKRAGAGQKR